MDFNISHPTEPGYRDVPIVISPIDLFKHELLFLLEGKNTDVLGDYDNWIDVEGLVFKSNVSAEDVDEKLRNAINQKSAYASDFIWDSNVYFMLSDTNDQIGVIEINIYDEVDSASATDQIKFMYST